MSITALSGLAAMGPGAITISSNGVACGDGAVVLNPNNQLGLLRVVWSVTAPVDSPPPPMPPMHTGNPPALPPSWPQPLPLQPPHLRPPPPRPPTLAPPRLPPLNRPAPGVGSPPLVHGGWLY